MNLTRRNLLGVGLTMGLTAVAGCTARRAGAPANVGGGVVAPTSMFAGTGFDGEDLVVRLVDDHDVTGVNLISPDGSLFAQMPVDIGVTTVRLPILDITPVRWVHYTPGVHELVAVRGEGEPETMEIEMHPDLRIVEVTQFREGEGGEFGQISIRIRNEGTGPSWVYDVAFENPPSWTGRGKIGDDPGIASFVYPDTGDLIIQPDQERVYVSGLRPLIIRNSEQTCLLDPQEFKIRVARPLEDPLEKSIRAIIGGNVEPAGLTGQYACSNVVLE